MDTDMPEMDGFEAVRMIRQKQAYFPIISTSADFTSKNRLLEIGADAFITKPFSPYELKRIILGWCRSPMSSSENQNVQRQSVEENGKR